MPWLACVLGARLAGFKAMIAVFNVEEKIGRTVGNRRPPTSIATKLLYTPEDARDWQREIRAPFVPKGVYRFASHEEADAWLLKMIARPRMGWSPASRLWRMWQSSAES